MLTSLTAIARTAFIESLRQPIFLVLVLVAGVLQVLVLASAGFTLGYNYDAAGDLAADNRMLFEVSLSSIFVCSLVLASLSATAIVSREIEKKTVLTVVSKPVPRAAVIVGKYLGVAGALTIAALIMVLIMLFTIRHGVMSTARDVIDQPVVAFGGGAILLSVILAAVGNFLYGWSFSQVAVVLMAPFLFVGYVITLHVSKEWTFQPTMTDLKTQVIAASYAILVSVLVLTAAATAASTRLGQVMTIVACLALFMVGLLSNYFVGRLAFENNPVGQIQAATTVDGETIYAVLGTEAEELAQERAERIAQVVGRDINSLFPDGVQPSQFIPWREALEMVDRGDPATDRVMFRGNDARYQITLDAPPDALVEVGTTIYYGASPNGVGLSVPSYTVDGLIDMSVNNLNAQSVPNAIVVESIDDLTYTVRQIGPRGIPTERPPLPNDYLFTQPTDIKPVQAVVWAALPNFQVYYLADAVTQGVRIPITHLLLVTAYAGMQVIVLLSLAVLMFQDRDVG